MSTQEERLAASKAAFAAETCTCGHRRDQHSYGGCGVDFFDYGQVYPCLCVRFTHGRPV